MMGLLESVPAAVEIATFASVVALAAVWLRSSLVKQRHEELEELAQTRGERIEDLKARIEELETWKDRMEGKFEALESLKVEQIVDGVAAAVIPVINEKFDGDPGS